MPDTYLLPHMNDCIGRSWETKVLIALDALWGYRKVPIKADIKNFSTFYFLAWHLPLHSYVAWFNKCACYVPGRVNIILSEIRWKMCLAYTFDVAICSKNNYQHIKDIKKVLILLRLPGVTLKLSKSCLLKEKIGYRGHIPLLGPLVAASKNGNAINTAFFPTDSTQIKLFEAHKMHTKDSSTLFPKKYRNLMPIYERIRNWMGWSLQLRH